MYFVDLGFAWVPSFGFEILGFEMVLRNGTLADMLGKGSWHVLDLLSFLPSSTPL